MYIQSTEPKIHPLLALMCYKATPMTSTGLSPTELLHEKYIRTTVLCRDASPKHLQAFYLNGRYVVKILPLSQPGDQVLLKLDEHKTWKGLASVIRDSCTQNPYKVDSLRGREEEERWERTGDMFNLCHQEQQQQIQRWWKRTQRQQERKHSTRALVRGRGLSEK